MIPFGPDSDAALFVVRYDVDCRTLEWMCVLRVLVLEGEHSDAEHFNAHAEGSVILVLFFSSSMQSSSGLCADKPSGFFGC